MDLEELTGLVPVISAATALVAVVASPVVAIRIARTQIRADVLAKNRQEWINTLRGELAHVIAFIRDLEMLSKLPEASRDPDRLSEVAHRGSFHEAKIGMMINPRETDHKQLLALVNRALHSATYARDDVHELSTDIVECAQGIFKREWERVKVLD